MNNKRKDLFLGSALAALGIAGTIGAGVAQANNPFEVADRTSDRILLASDSACGKGSCGTDTKGAKAAKKAHAKKGKESSCKTAEGAGKESSCKTSEEKKNSGEKNSH